MYTLQDVLRRMTNWQNSQWMRRAANLEDKEEARFYLNLHKPGRDDPDFFLARDNFY